MRRCPKCGFLLNENDRYCENCGEDCSAVEDSEVNEVVSPDEEKERGYGDNDAALYGSEYWEIVDNIEAWLNQNEDEACNLSDYFIETINEFLDNKGFGKYKPDAEPVSYTHLTLPTTPYV